MDFENLDLHIHSNFSDGSNSVSEIIKMLEKREIRIASITDHNTLKAYKEIKNLGNKKVKIIVGVEINTFFEQPIHILAYNFSLNNSYIKKKFQSIQNSYAKAILKLCFSLIKKNIIDEKILLEKNLTRRYLAEYLVKKGMCKTIKEAVITFLDYNKNNISPPKNLTLEEVIFLVRCNNGIPVLAHPGRIKKNRSEIIKKLVNFGLQGIECFHSEHKKIDEEEFVELSEKLNLLVTGGSDYHGLNKTNVELGRYIKGKWKKEIFDNFLKEVDYL